MLSIHIVPIMGNTFSLQIRCNNNIIDFWEVDITEATDKVKTLLDNWELVKSHYTYNHGNLKHKDCPICKEQ